VNDISYIKALLPVIINSINKSLNYLCHVLYCLHKSSAFKKRLNARKKHTRVLHGAAHKETVYPILFLKKKSL